MHIKIDEDLPVAIANLLRIKGYMVSTVVEQGMGGWKNLHCCITAQHPCEAGVVLWE